MLKIKVTKQYMVLWVEHFNDKEVTYICDTILDENGVAFNVYDDVIVVTSMLYETIVNLTERYDITIE